MKLYQQLFLIAMTLLIASASCNKVQELDYKGIQSTRLESASLSRASLRINLKYFNPNHFGLDVKESDLSIFLNDHFIAVADQPEVVKIPAQADFIFPVVTHFDPVKALGLAFTSIMTNKVKLRIQGSARIGKEGVYMKVPVAINEEIKILE